MHKVASRSGRPCSTMNLSPLCLAHRPETVLCNSQTAFPARLQSSIVCERSERSILLSVKEKAGNGDKEISLSPN